MGKSTLIHYLRNDPGPQQPKMTVDESAPVNNNIKSHYTQNIKTPIDSQEKRNDLALGYSFIDVKDEENEGKHDIYIYIWAKIYLYSRGKTGLLSTGIIFP